MPRPAAKGELEETALQRWAGAMCRQLTCVRALLSVCGRAGCYAVEAGGFRGKSFWKEKWF